MITDNKAYERAKVTICVTDRVRCLPVELINAHAVYARTAETSETGVRGPRRRAQQRRGRCEHHGHDGRYCWQTVRWHLAFPDGISGWRRSITTTATTTVRIDVLLKRVAHRSVAPRFQWLVTGRHIPRVCTVHV